MAILQVKKVLLIITLTLTTGSLFSPSKFSAFLLCWGAGTSGLYLAIAEKPWELGKNRQQKLSRIKAKYSHWRKEASGLYIKLRHISDIAELGQEKKELVGQISQLTQYAQSVVAKAEKEKKQISQEVAELKKLGDEIATNTERDARVAAAKIKEEAELQAKQIIEATKTNLQATVFEPEKFSHMAVLGKIQQEKDDAIAQLGRLQTLQDKTSAAIEKMKKAAQAEHLQIKEKLKKQAQAQFLKEMEKVEQIIEQLENQIKLLTSENQLLRSEIEDLDKPQYPEGYSDHEVFARGIIDFYNQLSIKLDYKLSYREKERIIVRVIPREEKVGEQQLRSFQDRLQRKFDLYSLPQITTTSGTIQFELQLREIQQITPEIRDMYTVPRPAYTVSTARLHPELIDVEEMRSHLQLQSQKTFQPPRQRFSPFEKLSQGERDWCLWLYNHCQIIDQNTIIHTVWRNTRGRGVTQGVGQSYLAAREKLHQILDEAGIPRRKSNNRGEVE